MGLSLAGPSTDLQPVSQSLFCFERQTVRWILMAGLSAIEHGWNEQAEWIVPVIERLPLDPNHRIFFKALMLYGLGQFAEAFRLLAYQSDEDNERLEQILLQEFRFPSDWKHSALNRLA